MTKVYITESGYKLNVASTLSYSAMTAGDILTLVKTVDGTGSGLDADTVDGSHASAFEAAGTVATHISDTSAVHDVTSLGTATGSSTNMLRVAAAGGLEYRTAAQVLSDIGAAPAASPTFTGTVTLPTTVASVIKPASDSTTALRLANAAGTAVLTVDTTNKLVNINAARTDSALCVNPGGLRNGMYITGELSGAYQNAFEIDVTGTNGTEVRGFTLQTRVKSGNSVTSAYGGYISSAVVSGTASNVYGLYIGNQTGASSANYAIYTGTGLIRFGDIVNFAGTMGNSTKVVGTDAPADWVQVQIGGTTYYLPAYAA